MHCSPSLLLAVGIQTRCWPLTEQPVAVPPANLVLQALQGTQMLNLMGMGRGMRITVRVLHLLCLLCLLCFVVRVLHLLGLHCRAVLRPCCAVPYMAGNLCPHQPMHPPCPMQAATGRPGMMQPNLMQNVAEM